MNTVRVKKSRTAQPIEQYPEHLYRVCLSVMPDGSFQKIIIKNDVGGITPKHYIITKNNHNLKAVHVDRHLVDGDTHASVNLDFSQGSAWCQEDAVEETAERIQAHILKKLQEAKAKIDTMVYTLEMKDPDVTKRDANEFG